VHLLLGKPPDPTGGQHHQHGVSSVVGEHLPSPDLSPPDLSHLLGGNGADECDRWCPEKRVPVDSADRELDDQVGLLDLMDDVGRSRRPESDVELHRRPCGWSRRDPALDDAEVKRSGRRRLQVNDRIGQTLALRSVEGARGDHQQIEIAAPRYEVAENEGSVQDHRLDRVAEHDSARRCDLTAEGVGGGVGSKRAQPSARTRSADRSR
jgi:hypothetical protein